MNQAAHVSLLNPSPPAGGLAQPLRDMLQRSGELMRRSRTRVHAGNGQPVIVFPVLGQGSESTAPLREALARAGYAALDWGHGVDRGPGGMGLDRFLRKLEECVIDAFEEAQRPVTLLGWGLSGIYARELAKRANPLVRQVITLGTPFNTAADPDRQCKLFRVLDNGPGRLPLAVRTRLRQCPPVPFTSIYSRDDGVVRWEQCIERETGSSENIEIPGAHHLELATHPKALEVISHRLAQPEGEWRPFASTSWLMAS